MGRIARIVIPGIPHHVTHRGNSKNTVFFCDEDRRVYLRLLRRFSMRHDLTVWGYCLMQNHVHLIVVPPRADALPMTMKVCQQMYAQYLNVRRQTSGHVWENRYFSCPLDRVHQWTALAYAERNPVAAGIVATADEYRWSSARAHRDSADPEGIVDLGIWSQEYTPTRWMKVLQSGIAAEADAERLRQATRRGLPLGDSSFIAQIECSLDRKLPHAHKLAGA